MNEQLNAISRAPDITSGSRAGSLDGCPISRRGPLWASALGYQVLLGRAHRPGIGAVHADGGANQE